ncbi:MAG TPA: PASTA domain-containing protein [Actinophytocola sp.]|nr:PASTA domain-containing protein [Actinophytocola sp.]
MSFLRYVTIVAFAAAAVVGCGSPSGTSEDGTTAVVQSPDEPEMSLRPPESPPAIATPTPAPAAPEQWPMPDVVGLSLQDAQDTIQATTGGAVFYSGSHDLGGEDRNQVLDANWQVCTQNVPPGTPITPTSTIDLGTVKLAESCP